MPTDWEADVSEVIRQLGYQPESRREIEAILRDSYADQEPEFTRPAELRKAALSQTVDYYETWDECLLEAGLKTLRQYAREQEKAHEHAYEMEI